MKDKDKEANTAIHHRVAAVREGRDATLIARLSSGWAVFGERQFVHGYLLLLPDPVVPTLNALKPKERSQFLMDASRLGDALLKVTNAVRINYAIFGNQEPALHAHIVPRYADEPEHLRVSHPWAYDWEKAAAFDREGLQPLAEALRHELSGMGSLKTMPSNPHE